MSKFIINPDFPVGNAAGWCKDLHEVKRLARSAASVIVVGSITCLRREGNPGQTFYTEGPWTLNSIGLKNPGIESIRESGQLMVSAAHAAGKPIIMSGAGFSVAQYRDLALAAVQAGFDGFEINLGCPNVIEGAKRHRIASFDPEFVDGILKEMPYCAETFFTAKVSPMTDPEQIHALANVIMPYGDRGVRAVVTMNTVPNCLLYGRDGGVDPAIQTPDKTGWAGFSGWAIKPLALGQVSQWRRALPSHIEVWGVGGVQLGLDVRDMLRAGASVVQVGTAYFDHPHGPKVFGDIAMDFLNQNEGEGR